MGNMLMDIKNGFCTWLIFKCPKLETIKRFLIGKFNSVPMLCPWCGEFGSKSCFADFWSIRCGSNTANVYVLNSRAISSAKNRTHIIRTSNVVQKDFRLHTPYEVLVWPLIGGWLWIRNKPGGRPAFGASDALFLCAGMKTKCTGRSHALANQVLCGSS